MLVTLSSPAGETRTTFPLVLSTSPTEMTLRGGDGSSVDLSDLAEGEFLTAHVVGDDPDAEVAFAVTRRDGILVGITAKGEHEIEHRPGWGPRNFFSPWTAVVRDGDDVVEVWPEARREDAESTVQERLAEYGRERGRWHPLPTCEIERTPRMSPEGFAPSASMPRR